MFCGSGDRMESGPHISLCIVLKSFCLWRKGTFDFKSSSGWHWIQCNVCVNSIARRLNNESKKSSFHSKRHNKKHNNSIELNNREWIDECFCDRLSIIIINIYVCSTYGCGRWVAKVGTWGRRFNYEQIFIVSYRCFQPFKASDLNGVCAWYLRWFLMLSLSLGKGRHHLMRVDWKRAWRVNVDGEWYNVASSAKFESEWRWWCRHAALGNFVKSSELGEAKASEVLRDWTGEPIGVSSERMQIIIMNYERIYGMCTTSSHYFDCIWFRKRIVAFLIFIEP